MDALKGKSEKCHPGRGSVARGKGGRLRREMWEDHLQTPGGDAIKVLGSSTKEHSTMNIPGPTLFQPAEVVMRVPLFPLELMETTERPKAQRSPAAAKNGSDGFKLRGNSGMVLGDPLAPIPL